MIIGVIIKDKFGEKPISPCCQNDVCFVEFKNHNGNKYFFCKNCRSELSKNNELVYPISNFNYTEGKFEIIDSG